jgi:hypothetical protein
MSTSGTTNPSVYKTLPIESAKNRPTTIVTGDKKTQSSLIISKFIQYMKNKHM